MDNSGGDGTGESRIKRDAYVRPWRYSGCREIKKEHMRLGTSGKAMKPRVVAPTPEIPSALSARPVSRDRGRYHGNASDVSDAGMKPSSARMLVTIVPRVLPNAVHMSIYYSTLRTYITRGTSVAIGKALLPGLKM